MRSTRVLAVAAAAFAIALSGCGSSADTAMQPNTQASTTGANVCETAVSDVYRIADEVYRVTTEGKTTTDSVEMGLASAVAFAACKTPAAVDAAINVWLSKARAAGNTDVDPPSAAAAASTRQVMCSSIIGDKPADFCD